MPLSGVQTADDGQSFALSLKGLSEEDARAFTDILNLSRLGGWRLVDSDRFDAAVVDSRSPKAQNLLRTRPVGAVVVMAIEPGSAASPGTVPLELPIREDSVWSALRRVRELLHRRLFLLRRDSEPIRPARSAPAEADDSLDTVAEFDRLDGLASHLRVWSAEGERAETKLCWLEGAPFLLLPKEKVWHGVRDSSIFRGLRGRGDLEVRVFSGELAAAHRAGPPRRLGDFLWHLGLHAGAGELLPGIDSEAELRLKRWPPMLGSENRTFYFRIGALLSKQPLSPTKLRDILGYEGSAVNDFINACFVTNCIELHHPKAASKVPSQIPPTQPVATAAPEALSLFGRIRRRLGRG